MAFRTDLAVEAIENMGKAADVRQVRQTDRTLEGFSVSEVEILTDRAAQEIGKPRGRYLTVALDALIRREEDAARSARCCASCCPERRSPARSWSRGWATA